MVKWCLGKNFVTYERWILPEFSEGHKCVGIKYFDFQMFSLYVSGKLPTYPSPKPTSTLTSHLGKNVGFGEG